MLFITLLFASVTAAAETHPIYHPTGDTSELISGLSAELSMTNTQLEALINTAGRANNPNIDTVQAFYDLALLYRLTSTTDYSHRATVLLERYAAVFHSCPMSLWT